MNATAYRPDVLARFWAKVNKTETCWLWTGCPMPRGYGKFLFDRRSVLAHRFAYELLVGPIPDGLTLDHVKSRGCLSRLCVRPEHLEPVTNRVNILRGDSFSAVNAKLTACRKGHPFDSANTLLLRSGRRQCRVCDRERHRRRPLDGASNAGSSS